MYKIKIKPWHILFFGLSLLGWLLFGLFCDLEAQTKLFGEPLDIVIGQYDQHSLKHTTRELLFATGTNLVQFKIKHQVNPWLTRGLNLAGGMAYEFGQGKIELLDLLFNQLGTELSLVPWYFIKQHKTAKEIKYTDKDGIIWNIRAEIIQK